MRAAPAVLLFAAVLAAGPAAGPAAAQTPVVDGVFDEWDGRAPVHLDPAGDGAALDLGRLWAASDAEYLYLSFEVGAVVNLQDRTALTLYVDGDDDPATGEAVGGIGAELSYGFGARSGTATLAGYAPAAIRHADLGLLTAPTVTSSRFEVAIRRDAAAGGRRLLTAGAVRLVLRDGSGDALPDGSGGVRVVLGSAPRGRPAVELGRARPGDVRLLTYNVLNDGLFRHELTEPFRRILRALDPDVIALQEVYTHTPAEAAARVAELLPPGPDAAWFGAGVGSDVLVVSRFPVRAATPLCAVPSVASTCNGAFRLDLRPRLDADLHLVVAHPPCCTNDRGRQEDFDLIAAHLRDARAAGTLGPRTAVVIAGDLNLVGDRRQVATLLAGAIVDTVRFGRATAPDADGTPLADAAPLTTGLPARITWTNAAETFSPGRLDYVAYSDALLAPGRGFALYTPGLTVAERAAAGLGPDDTAVSDHLPLVQDFALRTPATRAEGPLAPGAPALAGPTPHPVGAAAVLRYHTGAPGPVRLVLLDALGRTVRVLVDGVRAAGDHAASFERGPLAPGLYVLRVDAGGEVRARTIVLR